MPRVSYRIGINLRSDRIPESMEPPRGFEPRTDGLRNRRRSVFGSRHLIQLNTIPPYAVNLLTRYEPHNMATPWPHRQAVTHVDDACETRLVIRTARSHPNVQGMHRTAA